MKLLRLGLAVAFCIDAGVAVLSLVAPQLLTTLFDIPVKDPLVTQIGGGEFAVVALVYALAFCEPRRYRALLWLCALDQAFAVVLPGLAVLHGALPATWKIVAPIPFQALLTALFAVYAARPGAKRSATPFMQ